MTQPIKPGGADESHVVENLLQILWKALSAVQLYSPNNKIYLQAVDALRGALTLVWQRLDELQLQVSESALLWEDKKVLSQEDKSDSIPWTLFKDGVRSLTLSPGVEDREIIAFLHVIKDARLLAAEDPDDLLTLLWEEDFQHLRYGFVEISSDDVPRIQADTPVSQSESTPVSPGEIRGRLLREVEASGDTPEGVVDVDDFHSTLYFLDDWEVEYLTGEIDQEYQQNLRAKVLEILFEVFELQQNTKVRGEIISIIDSFLPHLLGVGDFQSVTLVVRRLRKLLDETQELTPDHRKAITALPVKLSNPTALGQLIQSLDDAAVQPTKDDIADFFGELGPHVLDTVLAWMPKLTNERVRETLRQVAERVAQEHPEQVVTALKTSDTAVLLQTLQLTSSLKVARLVPDFGRLLRHADTEIRRAAVDALGAIGSASAMKQLERSVEDEDRGIRIASIQYCVQHRYPGVLQKVEAVISGRALRGADLTEKKPFFEAYGLFCGNAGVDPLYQMLNAKRMFRRKDDPETRACAALALGKIGTPEARAALEKAKGVKDPLVRNAVGSALREIGL
ncbi:MAG: HEAT repeat domain-containing protein [Gemmatimonadetes bacterium]|nr:HEAT repeat domain-containing protein [Gemmatimonadota bacterium]